MPLNLPNDIVNGQNADATPVEQNFNLIQGYINTELIARDGSVAMTAPLLLAGDPVNGDQAANKDYVDAILPVGIMFPWPGKVAPSGNWMICDGRSLSQSAYPELFGVLGQTYGGGTGTFLLPKLVGRTIFGQDAADTDFATVGKVGGTTTVPVPQHLHAMAHTHLMPHTHEHPHNHPINHSHAATSSVTVSTNVATSVRDSPPGSSNSFVRAGTAGTTVNNTLNPTVTTDPHTHSVPLSTGLISGAVTEATTGGSSAASTGASSAANTSNTGTASAQMIPPYITMLYIIRVK